MVCILPNTGRTVHRPIGISCTPSYQDRSQETGSKCRGSRADLTRRYGNESGHQESKYPALHRLNSLIRCIDPFHPLFIACHVWMMDSCESPVSHADFLL